LRFGTKRKAVIIAVSLKAADDQHAQDIVGADVTELFVKLAEVLQSIGMMYSESHQASSCICRRGQRWW
jgi:hypothetical protein